MGRAFHVVQNAAGDNFLVEPTAGGGVLAVSGRSSWPAARKLILAARRKMQYFISRISKRISEIIRARRNKKQE